MPSSPNPSPEVAVILAGGAGTRLGALTAHTPKPLLEVAGRPFISLILDHLEWQGIRRAIIATGYLAEHFETALGRHHQSISLSYSREEAPRGTGGATFDAFAATGDPAAFVVNGDTLFPVVLGDLATIHSANGAAATLALHPQEDTGRFGRVELQDDRVVRFEEKGAVGPGLINGGVYLIDRAALLAENRSGAFSLERDIFPRWLAAGRIAGAVSGAPFIDIGVPADLQRARDLYS